MTGPTITASQFDVEINGRLIGQARRVCRTPDGTEKWEAWPADDVGRLRWSNYPLTTENLPSSQAAIDALLDRAGVGR